MPDRSDIIVGGLNLRPVWDHRAAEIRGKKVVHTGIVAPKAGHPWLWLHGPTPSQRDLHTVSLACLTSFLRLPTVLPMTARLTNGTAVRALREALGVKHGKFAVDCLISPGYLTNIEAGRKQPAPDVTRRIADRLGVELDAITYPAPGEEAA